MGEPVIFFLVSVPEANYSPRRISTATASITFGLVKKLVSSRLPTALGNFTMSAYGNEPDLFPHVVLQAPSIDGAVPLVRIHSECMTGDLFHSSRCDCGEQLDQSLEQIGKEGGVLIYLRQEGRGIGLVEKLKAYNLQDDGMDTITANEALGHQSDERSYEAAALILADLDIPAVRLMTNNPLKVESLKSLGIEVSHRVPLVIAAQPENAGYLEVKRAVMGHYLG